MIQQISLKMRIWTTLFCFFALSAINTKAQKKTITKGEERIIKQAARNIITELPKEYDHFLTSSVQERKDRLGDLLTPGEERMFWDNASKSYENDFAIRDIQDLPDSEKELTIEDYFDYLATHFGTKDNGENRNQGKQVTVSAPILKICYTPFDSTLFVKAYFTIQYDGGAENGYKFKSVGRVAELVMEKERRWRAYIRAIRFLDARDNENDYSKNVIVSEDNSKEAVNFAEILSNASLTKKMVSRDPLLKAYEQEASWGLLIDEDKEKKILAEPQWCDIENFEQGLAAVCREGSWGYINTKGELVIPYQYAQVSAFKNGKATVLKNGKLKPIVIDTFGNEIK